MPFLLWRGKKETFPYLFPSEKSFTFLRPSLKHQFLHDIFPNQLHLKSFLHCFCEFQASRSPYFITWYFAFSPSKLNYSYILSPLFTSINVLHFEGREQVLNFCHFEIPTLPPLLLVLTPIRHKLAHCPFTLPTSQLTFLFSLLIPEKEVSLILLKDNFPSCSDFHLCSLFPNSKLHQSLSPFHLSTISLSAVLLFSACMKNLISHP